MGDRDHSNYRSSDRPSHSRDPYRNRHDSRRDERSRYDYDDKRYSEYDRSESRRHHSHQHSPRSPSTSHKHTSDRESSRSKHRTTEKPRVKKSGFDVLPSNIPTEAIKSGFNLSRMTEDPLANVYEQSHPSLSQKCLNIVSLPPCTENELSSFVEDIVQKTVNRTIALPCLLSVSYSKEKSSAVLEFKNSEVCTACLALKNLLFKGAALKIMRPLDYLIPAVLVTNDVPIELDLSKIKDPSIYPSATMETQNENEAKIVIRNLPSNITERNLVDIFKNFGTIVQTYIPFDPSTGLNASYAYIIYDNLQSAENAITGMNKKEIQNNELSISLVQKPKQSALVMPIPEVTKNTEQSSTTTKDVITSLPSPKVLSQSDILNTLNQPIDLASDQAKAVAVSVLQQGFDSNIETGKDTKSSRILILLNMISKEELANDEEYMNIKNDIETELSKYGQVLSVVIPRRGDAGAGTVIVEYPNREQSAFAAVSIIGRCYHHKYLRVCFMSEEKFIAKKY